VLLGVATELASKVTRLLFRGSLSVPLPARFFKLGRGICASSLRPPGDALRVKSDEQSKGYISHAWSSGESAIIQTPTRTIHGKDRSCHIGGICQRVTGRDTGHGMAVDANSRRALISSKKSQGQKLDLVVKRD
jgi:hypothetical protein